MKKKLLALSTLGAISSVLPLSFVISCGINKVSDQENIYPLYKPFKVDVPAELVPGAKLDKEAYRKLKDWQEEGIVVSAPSSGGSITIDVPNVKWGFFFDGSSFGKDYLENTNNALKLVKAAIEQTNFSPMVYLNNENYYQFNVSTNSNESAGGITNSNHFKEDISYSNIFLHSKNSSGFVDIENFISTYVEAIIHEYGHGVFANDANLVTTKSINLLNEIIDSGIPLDIELFKKSLPDFVTDDYSKNSEQWISIESKPLSNVIQTFFQQLNADNTNRNILVNYYKNFGNIEQQRSIVTEFINFLSEIYTIKIPSSLPIGSFANILAVPLHMSKTYNFMDPSLPKQSYDNMKAWAKDVLNLSNGNNIRIRLDNANKDAITKIDFQSFGMPESNDINHIKIFDKVTNKVYYEEDVKHQDFPFGFNKNPFNDYEYQYVVPSAYDFIDLNKNPISVSDLNNLSVELTKIENGTTTKYDSNVNITSLQGNDTFKWDNNNWTKLIDN